MKAATGKCDIATTTLPVTVGQEGEYSYPMIEGTEAMRIGPVSSAFMLHVITDNPDTDCPALNIERIVECPNGCEFEEYKWSMPTPCTAHYLLPAGTYDITVCRQDVVSMQAGDNLSVTLMVEPVDDTFVRVYTQKD